MLTSVVTEWGCLLNGHEMGLFVDVCGHGVGCMLSGHGVGLFIVVCGNGMKLFADVSSHGISCLITFVPTEWGHLLKAVATVCGGWLTSVDAESERW